MEIGVQYSFQYLKFKTYREVEGIENNASATLILEAHLNRESG